MLKGHVTGSQDGQPVAPLPPGDEPSGASLPLRHVEGSFLVELEQPGPDSPSTATDLEPALHRLAASEGCSGVRAWPFLWDESSGIRGEALRHNWHVQFQDCGRDEAGTARLLAGLNQLRPVRRARINSVTSADLVPGAEPAPGDGSASPAGPDDHCPAVNSTGSAGPVLMALLDSGVDPEHPALKGIFARDEAGRIRGANFHGRGAHLAPDKDWQDENGHGTWMAGAMLGRGSRIRGLAACPDQNIRLLPVRVLGPDGRGDRIAIRRGIQWAVAQGARIITLGASTRSRAPGGEPERDSFFSQLPDRHVVVFAPAGNTAPLPVRDAEGADPTTIWPADQDGVLAVTAIGRDGFLPEFAGRGPHVDLAAPGEGILSAWPGGTARQMSGTSAAVAWTSAAWALALSSLPSGTSRPPHFSEVQELLHSAVHESFGRIDKALVAAGGTLDVHRLIRAARQAWPAPSPSPATDDDGILLSAGGEEDEAPSGTAGPSTGTDNPTDGGEDPAGLAFAAPLSGSLPEGPLRVALKNWPSGTHRVYLYWHRPGTPPGQPFSSVRSLNFDLQDSRVVYSLRRFYLTGTRDLTAVAVDRQGRILDHAVVRLTGL